MEYSVQHLSQFLWVFTLLHFKLLVYFWWITYFNSDLKKKTLFNEENTLKLTRGRKLQLEETFAHK